MPIRPARPRALALLAFAAVACGEPAERIPADITPADLALPPHATSPEPELPDGLRVRAATFNLHGTGDATPEAIGAFLATLDLDVVGLEECPGDAAPRIAASAGFASYAGDGEVLLSKTPIVGFEHVDLEARGYVRGTTSIAGVDFSVYVAHIGWNAEGSRQCRLFVDEHLTRDPSPHLLVLGDFNDEHYSPQITILESRLADAFTVANVFPGDRISWPATEFDGGEGSQLIDLVFFPKDLGVIVLSADVLNLSPVLSDHKPVVAELLYPRDAPFREDPFRARRDPAPGFPVGRQDNLLTNPGAEEGLTGWTVEGDARAEVSREHQAPHAGGKLFTGAPARSDEDPSISSGAQEVDLSAQSDLIDQGRGLLFAGAFVATGYETVVEGDVVADRPRPYDDGEIVVETLDAAGRVLGRHTSGRHDTLAWHPLEARVELAPGTRRARYRWLSHRKPASGPSSDAVFDDLYLGLGAASDPTAILGGDLVANGGADDGVIGWELGGWSRGGDLAPLGLILYPPWSSSGGGHFMLAPNDDGSARRGRLAPRLDLTAYAADRDAGRLALRWGGAVRTYVARARVGLALEILESDGSTWGTVAADPVFAAEWTRVESLTRVPPGASGVRLVVTSEVDAGEWAFADELFAVPERVNPR